MKTSKYNNSSCHCGNGHIHRSKFEAKVCVDLHYEYQKEIESKEVEIIAEKRFDFKINEEKICSHYMDFLIEFSNGTKKAVEAKGAQTSTWVIKSKLFKILYPEIEYEIRHYKPEKKVFKRRVVR